MLWAYFLPPWFSPCRRAAAECNCSFFTYESAHTNVVVAAHSWVFLPLHRPVALPQLCASTRALEPSSEAPYPRKASLIAPRDFPL